MPIEKEVVCLAVHEAVQAVLAKVLANPDLVQRLRLAPVPEMSSRRLALPVRPAVEQVQRATGWRAGTVKGAFGKATSAARHVGAQAAQALQHGKDSASALARHGEGTPPGRLAARPGAVRPRPAAAPPSWWRSRSGP
jgi:hypothetical protein